jgi:hypothetical protein
MLYNLHYIGQIEDLGMHVGPVNGTEEVLYVTPHNNLSNSHPGSKHYKSEQQQALVKFPIVLALTTISARIIEEETNFTISTKACLSCSCPPRLAAGMSFSLPSTAYVYAVVVCIYCYFSPPSNSNIPCDGMRPSGHTVASCFLNWTNSNLIKFKQYRPGVHVSFDLDRRDCCLAGTGVHVIRDPQLCTRVHAKVIVPLTS